MHGVIVKLLNAANQGFQEQQRIHDCNGKSKDMSILFGYLVIGFKIFW